MKKFIQDFKNWFANFSAKNPGKTLVAIIILVLIIAFNVFYSVMISYKSGKLEFELKKKEVQIKKYLKK